MRQRYTRSYSRLQRFQSPPLNVEDALTGIVPRLFETEMERTDPDLFVIAAETADISAYGFPHQVSSNGSGAGLTYETAHGAAVGECVERYALSTASDEDVVFSTYATLRERGLNPINPTRWALFSPSQYDHIPYARFEEKTPIGWLPAQSLTHQCDCLIPASMVHMPYRPAYRDQGEQVIAPAISTGAACARTHAEALLKGICELIERDAFMIMWRNRLGCPRVRINPQSELHPLFVQKFARPGLEYTLIQTTLDLGVPSFFGILRNNRLNPAGLVVGGAAHPNPTTAALKTLTELVQGLKWLDFRGNESFDAGSDFSLVRSFDDRMKLYGSGEHSAAFDFLDKEQTSIDLSTIAPFPIERDVSDAAASLTHAMLHSVIHSLAQQGLEVLAVDVTPADIEACNLCVTKVLIPEIEMMEGDYRFAFLGGSRWRDIPFRLGKVASPIGLDAINPFPHPYP